MNSSETRTTEPAATGVRVTDDELVVELVDGRTVSVPIAWFPRLLHGDPEERANWRLMGRGDGIHWHDLDEDIHVGDLLAGHRSGETQESVRCWLDSRGQSR
jgi:hypothetical protein